MWGVSVILCCISNTGLQSLLGATKVSWPPTFQKSGVSKWVPCLRKTVDLWEGACIEASVNFQNVTGCDSNNLTSSQCPLECFPVKGSRSDLSSPVSGIKAAHSCILALLPWTRNKTYHTVASSSYIWIFMCSTFVRASPLMTWSGPQEIIFNTWKMNASPIFPCLVIKSHKICVWGVPMCAYS